MTIYRIEPRDPLVVRDGRLNDGRSQSRGLGFPPPSVVAGVVRTGLGRDDGCFDKSRIERLMHVTVRGPLLASGGELYPPAPADALVTRSDEGAYAVQALRPIPTPDGCLTSHAGKLIGLPAGEVRKTKPARGAPRFWSWGAFAGWLHKPEERKGTAAKELLEGGLVKLVDEARMHVAIDRDTGTAVEGKLFGTTGTRGWARRWSDEVTESSASAFESLDNTHRRVHLEVDVEVGAGDAFPGQLEGLRPMAGERRLTSWSKAATTWPSVPSWLREHVRGAQGALVRLVLLTPAYLESSLEPECLREDGVELVAARVDRPMTISGWDFAKGAPKKTRRLAPAGSVYWLRLTGDADAREAWVERRWLQNMGDDEQLVRDGFGLAAIGIGTEVTS